MVYNDINHNLNATFLGLINQIIQIRSIPQMLVSLCKILCPVSMIALLVQFNIYNVINIIHNRSNPDCVNPKILQIAKLACKPLEIAAVVTLYLCLVHIVIVGCIPVHKTVREQEVYS